MDDDSYSARFVPVSSLGDDIRARMARIYLASYDGSSQAIFFGDVATKDEVLLVHSADELIGFTTLRTFDYAWEGRRVRVVYSGDTVVDRARLDGPGAQWTNSSANTRTSRCSGFCS